MTDVELAERIEREWYASPHPTDPRVVPALVVGWHLLGLLNLLHEVTDEPQ